MDEVGAAHFDQGAEHDVDHARGHNAAHGGGNAPSLHAIEYGGDKGEGRCEEDRHLAFSNQLEQ